MTNPLPTAPAEPRPVFTLTAADRCDKRGCGSRAYVRAVLSVDEDLACTELLSCSHHAREVEPLLRSRAIGWVDESAAILA